MHRQRLVAVRAVACGQHVIFRPRPPDADEVIHREADVRGLLDRHGVHHAPAPEQDIVRLVAADLEPLAFLFLAGRIDGDLGQFKAVLLGQFLKRADRLLPVGGVVVEQRDLLAVQVAAILVQQVLDRHAGAVPVVRRVVEDVAEHLAVRGRGAAIARRVKRDAVRGHFRDQLIGDAGGQRVVDQRAFALGRLIAFDALFGVIGGLAFRGQDLFAADPAIAFIEQGEIVVEPIGILRAVRAVRAGAIGKVRHDQIGHGRRRGHHGPQRDAC